MATIILGENSERARRILRRGARHWRARLRPLDEGRTWLLEGTADDVRAAESVARRLRAAGVPAGVRADVRPTLAPLRRLVEEELETAEAMVAARDLADAAQDIVDRISRLMVDGVMTVHRQLAERVDPDVADRWRDAVLPTLEKLLDDAVEAKDRLVSANLALRGGEMPTDDLASDDGMAALEPRAGDGEEGDAEADPGTTAEVPPLLPADAEPVVTPRRRRRVAEAWGVRAVNPRERGKYEDATLEELCRLYRAYRRWRRGEGRRPRWKGKPLDIHEVLFAIRAKSGKYRWGSPKRICGIEGD